MTIRLTNTKPLSAEQKERTRSIIIAGAFTAGMTALVLLCGGAQAAEVCKPPTDSSGCVRGGLSGGEQCFKVVKAENMPSVNGGRYVMFEIQTWSKTKCAWSDRTRRVDEYTVGQTVAKRFATTQEAAAAAVQPKQ